jgi:hypothetical protein
MRNVESNNSLGIDIFDSSNVHKMKYSLEIVESILVRDQKEKTTLEWVSRFLELKGFEQL